MKYLMGALAGGATILALVWICGVLLPLKHEASASIRVKAAPEAVWAVLTDVEKYPEWRSDVAFVKIIQTHPFRIWMETDADGIAVDHAEGVLRPAVKWADRTAFSEGGVRKERVFLLVADAEGGTRIALTETEQIRGPLARFRARFIFGYATELKTLLDGLRRRLAG